MVYAYALSLMKLERNIKTANQTTFLKHLPAYAEYGAAHGYPVLFFHGTPGSRLERFFTESALRDAGIRLIVVERPGYGQSAFDATRKLLDWPDAVVRLADALQLEQFSVAGFSGGGPYAAACAYRMPQRLLHTALISSSAPFTVAGLLDQMLPGNRSLFEQAVDDYLVLAQQLESLIETPASLYGLFEEPALQPDSKVLADPHFREMYLANLAESMHQGMRALAYDMALLASPWGFEPAQITGSVSVWYGEQDVFTPPAMGHHLAQTIAACSRFPSPHQGHFLMLEQQHRMFELLSSK